MVLIVTCHTIPGLAGCSWPAPPAGFGISRVLSAGSSISADNRHRVACHPAKRNRVAPRPFKTAVNKTVTGAPVSSKGEVAE